VAEAIVPIAFSTHMLCRTCCSEDY